jgi:uncharacterized protein (TIGR02246 family)
MVVSDEAAVLAVLDRFRRAWEQGDAASVLSCFARGPETVVIGTDAGEYWRGYDALVEPFRTMTAAFTDLHYEWVDAPNIAVAEDVAWADAVLDTRLTAADGAQLAVTMRTSWVLRHASGWEVVQAHFSVAPPSPVAVY